MWLVTLITKYGVGELEACRDSEIGPLAGISSEIAVGVLWLAQCQLNSKTQRSQAWIHKVGFLPISAEAKIVPTSWRTNLRAPKIGSLESGLEGLAWRLEHAGV